MIQTTTPMTPMTPMTIVCVDPQTFYARLDKLEQLLSQEKKTDSVPMQDRLLTRDETAAMLKISLPTLHDWTNRGMLQSYRIGNIVRYKEVEVLASLAPIKKHKIRND